MWGFRRSRFKRNQLEEKRPGAGAGAGEGEGEGEASQLTCKLDASICIISDKIRPGFLGSAILLHGRPELVRTATAAHLHNYNLHKFHYHN